MILKFSHVKLKMFSKTNIGLLVGGKEKTKKMTSMPALMLSLKPGG